mgnify:CR=1 FL=1|jgi:hypothetical protein
MSPQGGASIVEALRQGGWPAGEQDQIIDAVQTQLMEVHMAVLGLNL